MTDQQQDAGHMGMNMDGLQTMGIVNAMRTGDSRVDIVIAMLIPLVLRLIFDFAKRSEKIFTADFWIDLHKKWFEVDEDECERVLMYSTRTKDENKNTLLSKAVLLYVNQVLHIELTNANIYLTSPKEQGTHSNNYNYYYDDCDDDEDDDEKPETYADRLGKLQVLKMPIDDEWVELGPPPVGGGGKAPSSSSCSSNSAPVQMHYSRNEKEGANNDLVDVVTTLRFRSKSRLAIDNFIDRAYHYYVEEMKKTETNHRYFYELKKVGDNMDGDYDTYTRYRLSDEKTFDSLFFPEKESLLRLLQHFLDRSGKYAIKGYPHKLGLLLHGPPGTGKTSFIKALAEHTGRSIININLSMIRTNKHLMKIFFNKSRSVEGEYMDDEVGFKDAIFVMEDVDSASNVVKRRDGKKTSDVVQTESVDIQPKSIWHMLLNSNDSDCQALVTKLMELSEKLAEEAKKPEVLQGVVQQMKSLPGLTVVSETVEDPSLKKIGDDALEEANKIMEKSTKVSEFLAFHARKLMTLLESGAEISADVVNELLETGVSTISETELNSADESARDVSWSKPQWGFSDFVERPLFLPTMKKGSEAATATSGGGKDVGAIGSGGKGGAAFGTAKGGKDDVFDMGGLGGGLGGFSPFASVYSDALNLSGLLNCLDGVVDSPGRLVILTSNHPEVLDPALVRPGRIDKKFMLGYMNSPEIVQMLEHYFQTKLTDEQCERIELAIVARESKPRLDLTPAQVEQLTAEHEQVDEMIEALENKSRPALPRPKRHSLLEGSDGSTVISMRGISIKYDGA